MTTKEAYTHELESAFDWDAIKADCIQSAIYELGELDLSDEYLPDDVIDEEGNLVGRSFLGTVFALCPSGKYYMPFACSNVDECPECGGDGHARDTGGIDIDELDDDESLSELEPLTEACPHCNATGKRTIAELATIRNETYQACLDRFLAQDENVLWDDTPNSHYILCPSCKSTPRVYGIGKIFVTCPSCNGLGSREAYLDELWYEALETVTEAHGGWSQNGEGDPCDIFYCQWVSPCEIVSHLGDNLSDKVKAWLDRIGDLREVKQALRVYTSTRNKLNMVV